MALWSVTLRALLPLSLGLGALLLAPRAGRGEEFIYLGSGPILGDRARQVRMPAGPGPGVGWQAPGFNDSAWGLPVPVPIQPPGQPGAAPGQPLIQPPGMTPDGGAPPCQGTLYLRRSFDVGPELPRLAGLALRLRYEDGFAAYLNGVEVARRRLPESADAGTLASELRPSEQETYYLPVSRGLLRARDNLFAIEVHPRTAERCARVDLELSAADGARVVRGPYIEHLTESSIDLSVESDVPTAIEVRYGKGPSRTEKDRRVRDTGAQAMHRVRITGLRAATAYHYQVSLRLPGGATTDLPEAAFHTPPRAGRPLRFVVYGDSRSGHDVHAQVVQSILREDPDLVLQTGDVVERGTEEGDWDRFFQVAGPLLRRVPVYMAPGNHEYARRGQGAQRLFDFFATMFTPQEAPARPGLPRAVMAAPESEGPSERGYYSFDAAGVHFVALDSNQYRSPRQLRWLEDDLQRAAARRVRATFVWAHAGPYSSGLHGDNGEAIRSYVPLLERFGVTYFFSGHDHDYERGRRGRLSYIVTGGGGAELRPLRCGGPGKKPCKHQPQAFINDHNYVSVEVLPGLLRVCPRRIDGTPLEPCQQARLSR